MVDLISFPGGKPPSIAEEEPDLMSCANCGGHLFNWRISADTTNHLMSCANCGYRFPIEDATPIELIDVDDEWI